MNCESKKIARLAKFAGACLVLSALSLAVADVGAQVAKGKDESKVKLSATAGKIEGNGTQTVTIKMQIDKGWHAYANPVKNETLEAAQTEIKIKGAKQLEKVAIAYPAGHLQKVGDETYSVYEGSVEIKATVTRTAGDTGPLEVLVNYSVCNDKLCLPPETVKLAVK